MAARWSWNAMLKRERRGEPVWAGAGVRKVATVDLVDESNDPRARVVIVKRDKEEPMVEPKKTWMGRMRGDLESLAKRDNNVAKADVLARVRKRAEKKALKTGGNADLIEARIWRDLYSADAPVDYDLSPIQKRATVTVAITKAEGEIEARARRIQKRDGSTYAAAVARALDEEPSLYTRYLEEVEVQKRAVKDDPGTADGRDEDGQDDEDEDDGDDGDDEDQDATGHDHTIQDREPTGRYRQKRKGSDSDGATRVRSCAKADSYECPECGSDNVEPGDSYCSSCGVPLKASKRRARA